jgi:hypothetical protein
MNLNFNIPHNSGGDYMGGSFHFDQQSKSWFISVYRESKKYKIFRHPVTREPLHAERSAEKVPDRIRSEIDYGEFVPISYHRDSPLSITKNATCRLESTVVIPNTFQSYRSAANNFIIPCFANKDIRDTRYNDLVREQLGHTKMEMTRRYAKRSQSKLTNALRKRPKVVEIKEVENER